MLSQHTLVGTTLYFVILGKKFITQFKNMLLGDYWTFKTKHEPHNSWKHRYFVLYTATNNQ